MKERPILMSSPMIRALLAGAKTQTRRIVGEKHLPFIEDLTGRYLAGEWEDRPFPYGKPGDRLWVRETFYAYGRWETRFNPAKKRDEWHFLDFTLDVPGRSYEYSEPENYKPGKRSGVYRQWWKRPAIFMPRWASRLTLEITAVRVERLQDISEEDALADGGWTYRTCPVHKNPVESFRLLWQQINGADSWDANPWVWVIEFRRLEL